MFVCHNRLIHGAILGTVNLTGMAFDGSQLPGRLICDLRNVSEDMSMPAKNGIGRLGGTVEAYVSSANVRDIFYTKIFAFSYTIFLRQKFYFFYTNFFFHANIFFLFFYTKSFAFYTNIFSTNIF